MSGTDQRSELDQYLSDDEVNDALLVADSDAESAAKLLLIAARYLREGKALPGNLADHLASAFEVSMGKPKDFRGGALLNELFFEVGSEKTKGSFIKFGADVERLSTKGKIGETIQTLSDKGGFDKRTGESYWHQYKKESAKFDADMSERLNKKMTEK